jgi:hypothetical protein
MSTQGTSNRTVGTREQKRARFDENAKASNAKKSAMVVGAVVVGIVIASAFFLLEGGDTNTNVARATSPVTSPAVPGTRIDPAGGATAASARELSPEGDVLRIPASSITTEATFFRATAGGSTVPFFAVRDAAGTVHVALDACQACAMAKKGYTQAGDAMKCRNCGMTFPIAKITAMGDEGGCHPILLPTTTAGDAIVVKASDLTAGAKWF